MIYNWCLSRVVTLITDTAANFILAYTHMYFLIEEVRSIVMMPLGCNVKGSYFVTKLDPFPKPLIHNKQENTQMINNQYLCRGSTTLGTFIGSMKRKRTLIGIKAIGHSSYLELQQLYLQELELRG